MRRRHHDGDKNDGNRGAGNEMCAGRFRLHHLRRFRLHHLNPIRALLSLEHAVKKLQANECPCLSHAPTQWTGFIDAAKIDWHDGGH
jgi:hypothetical protein